MSIYTYIYIYIYISFVSCNMCISYNTYVHCICKLHRGKLWKYVCQEIALLLSLYKVRESLTNKVSNESQICMCVLLSFVAEE